MEDNADQRSLVSRVSSEASSYSSTGRPQVQELQVDSQETQQRWEADYHNTPAGSIQMDRLSASQTRVPSTDHKKTSEIRKPSPFFRWWWQEIACGLVALASFTAEVVILQRYDGKPIESWPSTVLTLNGMVAILATLCRAGFMLAVAACMSQARWNSFSGRDDQKYHRLGDFQVFDEASRGSWGSLKLIWRFKLFHISCLGALLTIFSLAFSAFSQQLITTQIVMIPNQRPDHLGAVANGKWVDQVAGISNSWYPLSATRLAMYDGFMAPNIDIPQVTCPTGNCTWPTVPTVGVCGSCVDLTEEIEIIRSPSELCIVTMPSGVSLRGYCNSIDWMTVFTLSPGSGRAFNSTHPNTPKPDAPNVIGQFSVLGLPASVTPGATLNESRAAECGIWYCLQARNVSVELGKLKDETVDIWSEAIEIASAPYSGNVTFTNIPPAFNVGDEDVYGMAAMQMYAMKQYLNTTIVGNVSADGVVGVVASSNDYADAVFNNFDNLDAWMERLARSMTNNVRQNSTGVTDMSRYQGTAFANQAIYVVRWDWISYPAALILLSAIYIIVEMARTTYNKSPPWKSDPLLPICINIEDEVREKAVTGMDVPDGVKGKIGEYRARLRSSSGGLLSFDLHEENLRDG